MARKYWILLYKGTGIISRLISLVTQSDITHAGWMFDEDTVLEADWDGVKLSPLSKYDLKRVVFVSANAPPECVRKAFEIALSKLGRAYDYKLFFLLGIAFLFDRFIRKPFSAIFGIFKTSVRAQRIADWPSAYICSELVAKPLFEACGFRFKDNIDPQNITPKDIWESKKVFKQKLT
ncbi:MAG: hypothetical protein DRJ03_17010 [Chloroflexi bacterium]|nr:MAG: hypothetical protein DRJ03_17010 [Chloroflexota bacterium]